TERSLKETEKRCQLLLDSSVDAIAYVLDGMHIYANRSYTQLFGYEDADDLAAEPMLELIAPKDQDSFKEFLRTYAAKGEYGETRCTAVTSDGQEFPAMLSFSPPTTTGNPAPRWSSARKPPAPSSRKNSRPWPVTTWWPACSTARGSRNNWTASASRRSTAASRAPWHTSVSTVSAHCRPISVSAARIWCWLTSRRSCVSIFRRM